MFGWLETVGSWIGKVVDSVIDNSGVIATVCLAAAAVIFVGLTYAPVVIAVPAAVVTYGAYVVVGLILGGLETGGVYLVRTHMEARARAQAQRGAQANDARNIEVQGLRADVEGRNLGAQNINAIAADANPVIINLNNQLNQQAELLRNVQAVQNQQGIQVNLLQVRVEGVDMERDEDQVNIQQQLNNLQGENAELRAQMGQVVEALVANGIFNNANIRNAQGNENNNQRGPQNNR